MSTIEIPIQHVSGPTSTDRSRSSAPRFGQKRVGITTLGCKVNAYESELISGTLRTQNWHVVSAEQVADLYLINTCTVTKEADRQARQAVRRVVKRNPDALVVVTGCYAQIDPQACAQIPGVDLVLGNDQKLDVHALLPRLANGDLPKVLVGDLHENVSLPDQLLTGFDSQTRAFVQIQQGCDQGCTFCIIHVARGPSRSLPPTLIKRQVQRLVMNGYAEIVICGVDLGSYGDDFQDQEFNLVQLLKELLALEFDARNPFRIRLSSLDPHHISDELIELMASEERLCPQFHLSLQSGNTLILKRMKRRYTADQVFARIARLRSAVPELVLSADVMVGFPTETEDQFQDTLSALERLDIAFPHVFSYSERSGTPAARIPAERQVPVAERKLRNQRAREAGAEILARLMQRKLGTTAWLLPESNQDGSHRVLCRGEDYVPAWAPNDTIELGVWQPFTLQRIEHGKLIAEPVQR